MRKGGVTLIVDFHKRKTDLGPPVGIRVSQTRAVRLFEDNGFFLQKASELPYHYLLVFAKN